MKIASLTEDRKKLVKALEKATGEKAKYLGAPSFDYEIGPYTVDRTGDITVEDSAADENVLAELIAKGLVTIPEGADQTATIIFIPMSDHDGRSLKNMVNMIYSKGTLLSKAEGIPGFYKASEDLVRALDAKAPQSADDFLQVVAETEDDALKGLTFEDGKIGFLFPSTMDPDRIKAYMQLTELMAKMAREQKRVNAAKCKNTNEKYTFRVWLMRLGMKGDEYKIARKIFLGNLRGHVAFRTKSQEEAAREKIKHQRELEREAADELAFEEL